MFSPQRVFHTTTLPSVVVCNDDRVCVSLSLSQKSVNGHTDISERSSSWGHSDETYLIPMRHVETSTLDLKQAPQRLSSKPLQQRDSTNK